MATDVVRPPTGTGGGSGGSAAPPEPGFVARLVAFYHGVVAEMKKVTWPEVAQIRQATTAIIIFVLVLGLFIWLLDTVLAGLLVQLLPSLFGGK